MNLRNLAVFGLVTVAAYAAFAWHMSLLTDASAELHLPAVGFEIFVPVGPWLLQLLAWSLALVLGLSAAGLFVAREKQWPHSSLGLLLIVGGSLALLLQLLTTEKRLVFNYFPSFALIATGLACWARSHVPLLMLLSSLYFGAATHKLLNFPKMLQYLPETIGVRLPVALVESFPDFARWLPQLLSIIVVPLEFSMAIFLLVPRLRKLGFLLALTFHSLVTTFTNGADALALVGFFVLYTHGLQFLFFVSRPIVLTWYNFPRAILVGLIVSLLVWFTLTHPDLLGLKSAIAMYFPILNIVAVAFAAISKEERAQLRLWLPEIPRRPWVVGWAALIVLWCSYPAMIGYRNQQYGWAMMSGAHLDKAFNCFVVARTNCADRWNLEPQVKMFRNADRLIFVGGYTQQLGIVKEELRKRCALNTSAIGRFHVSGFRSGGSVFCQTDGL
jgi:hypothetical protein